MDDEKPFDAAEIYLGETDQEPSPRWRTVSLVTAPFVLLGYGPQPGRDTTEARRNTIKAAASELTRRGVDAVPLVRYGLWQEVVAPVCSALLLKLILGEDSTAEGVDVPGWCAALGIDVPAPLKEKSTSIHEVDARLTEVIIPAFSRIKQWVGNSTLDEIISLRPPRPCELASTAAPVASDGTLREQYRWIVDHFAQTYYRRWATSSLHSEMRWLDGDSTAPCPEELMADRVVPRKDLVEEIARRAVYLTDAHDLNDSIYAEMRRHAKALLRQGRHREAAAVSEFGVIQRPNDPALRNDLGFCLIPIDPKAALGHLQAASKIGYRPTATNSYNQMCCHWAARNSLMALRVASAEWSKAGTVSEDALLWRQTDRGDWELYDDDDPVRSIAFFAAEIARRAGLKSQAVQWQNKAKTRSSRS